MTDNGAVCVCPEGSLLQDNGQVCTGMAYIAVDHSLYRCGIIVISGAFMCVCVCDKYYYVISRNYKRIVEIKQPR